MATPTKRRGDMTKAELQTECKKLRRKVSGTKDELLWRLKQVGQTNDRGWQRQISSRSKCLTYLASGEHRHVYHGHYIKGPRTGEQAVKKVFKTGSVFKASAFKTDMATNDKAREIITAFNSHNSSFRCTGNETMTLRKPVYLNMPDVWTSTGADKAKCLVEPMISGQCTKMKSNTGWVKDQASLTDALSHFSYHHTGGQCLLCDLQGNENGSRFLLTDPAIHSVGEAYGPTDGGREQMVAFFQKHKCNSFCHASWSRAADYNPYNGKPTRMGTAFFLEVLISRNVGRKVCIGAWSL